MQKDGVAVFGELQVHLHGPVALLLGESDAGERVLRVASAVADDRVRSDGLRESTNALLDSVGDAKESV